MMVINEISKAFNRQAKEYEEKAIVQQEIGERLFERLQYMKISPQRILDLGCGTGHFTQSLRLKYPKAQVLGLDLAFDMLLQAKKKQLWRRKWPLVTADMHHLPFANGSFDLVFANQVIHWGDSLHPIFNELNRVMRMNACLMFTTLGPDTFKEIRQAWAGVNQYAHANEFWDMHDVGDALVKEHFLEPVMDMELLAVHYGSLHQLIDALKKQGVKNINPKRNKGLTSRGSWASFENNYAHFLTDKGKYPLTYEVIFGQAWKGEQRQMAKGIETLIPLTKLKLKG